MSSIPLTQRLVDIAKKKAEIILAESEKIVAKREYDRNPIHDNFFEVTSISRKIRRLKRELKEI